jgi:hypothetical protein
MGLNKNFVPIGKEEIDPSEMYPIKDELNSDNTMKFE